MTRITKLGAMALLLTLGVTACNTDDITSVNDNPNAPTTVEPRFLMPAIAHEGVEAVMGYPSVSLEWANPWVQHYASLQYGYTDRYETPADFSDEYWDLFWLDPIPDAQTMVELGREQGAPNVEAVGLVMKSYLFQAVTDIWGDVPYSEAARPDSTIAPVYDPQQEIYDGILSDLKAAQDMFDPSSSLFERQSASFDIIFQGDVEKWRRFANSLRLRAGMRLSEVNPSRAASVAQSAIADGVIQTKADQPMLRYPGSPPNEQPWSVHFRERLADYRASSTMVDSMKALDDPRLKVYFTRAPADGEFRGKPNGTKDTHGIAYETLSDIGDFWKQNDLPTWIMTLEEVLFLRAEAAARGWTSGDAEQLYYDGIRSAMRRVGVAEDSIEAYLQHPRVQWEADQWKQKIAMQKWIALFQNGMEAWAEYRRLGYPDLEPGPAAVKPKVPLRAPYPAHEEDLNNANLQQARDRQGGDAMTNPVWWDVNN